MQLPSSRSSKFMVTETAVKRGGLSDNLQPARKVDKCHALQHALQRRATAVEVPHQPNQQKVDITEFVAKMGAKDIAVPHHRHLPAILLCTKDGLKMVPHGSPEVDSASSVQSAQGWTHGAACPDQNLGKEEIFNDLREPSTSFDREADFMDAPSDGALLLGGHDEWPLALKEDSTASQATGKSAAMPQPAMDETLCSSPSIGSALHARGKCQECIYAWSAKGCTNGAACTYCHFRHNPATRSKLRPCKAKRVAYRRLIEKLAAEYGQNLEKPQPNVGPSVFDVVARAAPALMRSIRVSPPLKSLSSGQTQIDCTDDLLKGFVVSF